MVDPLCTFVITSVGGGLLALLTNPEQPRFIPASRRPSKKSVRRCALVLVRAVPSDIDGVCPEVAGAQPFPMLVIGWTEIPQNKLNVLVFNKNGSQ